MFYSCLSHLLSYSLSSFSLISVISMVFLYLISLKAISISLIFSARSVARFLLCFSSSSRSLTFQNNFMI